MRVMHITTHFNVGGITKYIMLLARALAANGVSVSVASGGGELVGELSRSGVVHHKLNIMTKCEFAPKVIASGFRLAEIVRAEKIDLMHAHSRVSQVAAHIASCLTHVPYVTTCHGYFKKRARGIFDTWGVKVVAISDAVKVHLEQDLGVHPDRISLIYSGIDGAKFSTAATSGERARARAVFGLKDMYVIGTIGRLSPVKGQRFILEALPEILRSLPGTICLIVGSGDQMGALASLADSLGVSENVRFVPSVSDTCEALAAMDLFVFPSIKEGLGIALLEAMAAGVASVSSDVGGIRDIVRGGETGILVPPEDAHAIADGVVKMLSDGALRSRIAAAGRADILARFSSDRMAQSMTEFYKEAVYSNRRGLT